jgi:hypothetical protein
MAQSIGCSVVVFRVLTDSQGMSEDIWRFVDGEFVQLVNGDGTI